MEFFAPALMVGFILAFAGFGMWLRQQRRLLIHRERLAAIEKGLEPLPPVELEATRITFNVQRLLLLAGLVWISVGIGFYLVFSTMLNHRIPATADIPNGVQYVGVGMMLIGVSHLIAYAVGRNKER